MKRSVMPVVAAATVVAVFSSVVLAQTMRPDRSIKYRQGIMQAMGWNAGVLGGMAKGDIPFDKDRAIKAANNINELAAMPWEGFVTVSDQGNTKAKPEIWKDKAKFDKLAEAMQAETPKLLAAAKTGDIAQIRPALGAVGKACNTCHDDFQAK